MVEKVSDRAQVATHLNNEPLPAQKKPPFSPHLTPYSIKNVADSVEVGQHREFNFLSAFREEVQALARSQPEGAAVVLEKLARLRQRIENIDENSRFVHDKAYEKLCKNYEAEQNRMTKAIKKTEIALEGTRTQKGEKVLQLTAEKRRLLARLKQLEGSATAEGSSKIQKKIEKRIKKIDNKIHIIAQHIRQQECRLEQAWAYWERRVDNDAARASYQAQEKACLAVIDEFKCTQKMTQNLIRLIKKNSARKLTPQKIERARALRTELKEIRIDMEAAMEFYRGLAGVAGQKQQILFDKENQFSIFSDHASVGTAITKDKGWALKLGGALNVIGAKFSLFGKVASKQTHTVSVDKSDDYNYMERTERSVGAGAEGKIAEGLLKVKGDVQGTLTDMKNYVEASIFNPDALKFLSKHNLIRHNDERLLSDRALANKKVRLMYRRATQLRNVVKRGIGFPAKNPYAPRYLKTKTAERAALASYSLVERFQQRGIRVDARDFHVDQVVPIPGIIAKDKPLSAGALSVTLSAEMVADIVPIESLKTFATENGVRLPSADMSMRAATGIRYSWFDVTKTDSSKTLLNPAVTYSYAKTQTLIDQAWGYWQEKSANISQDLPVHLHGVQKLYALPATEDAQEMISRLRSSQNEVKQLKAHLHEWQTMANRAQSLSIKLTKKEKLGILKYGAIQQEESPAHSINIAVGVNGAHSSAQKFREASQAIQAYQFPAARLPLVQIHSIDAIKEVVTETYDNFSIAAATLEHINRLDIVEKLLKSESILPDVRQELEKAARDFVKDFNRFSAELESVNVGLTRQHLLKNSLFQAAGKIKKYAMNVEGTASAGVGIPVTQGYTTDAELRVGIGTKVEGELVVGHTNSIRNDWYSTTTFSGELRLFGLEEKLIKEGLKNWFLEKSIPELDAKLLIEVLANLGGYTTGSATLTLTINRKGGILEAIRVNCVQLKDASNTLAIPAYGPVSGAISFTDKLIKTEVLQELIGSDLSYHIMQKNRFGPAWEEAGHDPQQLYRFFGLNSIAQLLADFSKADLNAPPRKPGVLNTYQDSFSFLKKLTDKAIVDTEKKEKGLEFPLDELAFSGVEVFNRVFVDEFTRRKKVAATSAKNFIQTLDQAQAEKAEKRETKADAEVKAQEVTNEGVAALQRRLRKLLEAEVGEGKSAAIYLEEANATQRYQFYSQHPIGVQLIKGYRELIQQGGELKTYLGRWGTVMRDAA